LAFSCLFVSVLPLPISDDDRVFIIRQGAGSGILYHPDITTAFSRGRKPTGGTGSKQNVPRPLVASLGEADRAEEDFNRDEAARATGFIGRSSEIWWLQRLRREVRGEVCGGRSNNTHHHHPAEGAAYSSPFISEFDGLSNVMPIARHRITTPTT
jgi:hypothetical protein